MSWLFAIIGGVLGGSLADTSSGFMGVAIGLFVGWLFGSISRLKSRVSQLEKALAEAAPAPAAVDASSVRPTPAETFPAWSGSPAEAAVDFAHAEDRAAPAAHAAAASTRDLEGGSREAARASNAKRTAGIADSTNRIDAELRAPSLAERAIAFVKRWFSEGNLPVRIGMLLLFFGIAALLKYAVDQGMLVLPVEMWFALVAAVAVAGLIFGWRQRETRRAFGLALQGGAIGVLLLTVFAAFRLYQLLPAGLALGLIVFLVAASALLAVLQNSLALAVLGFTGGFLAPVLIATGSGSHVALFTYYAVLNAAVFAVAWVRPWRVLNLVGFGFTFVVGSLWGYRYYTPAHFGSVEPFLILFFLFYVGIGVLYVLRQPQLRRPYVDGTLTFGTPLLAFPLQAAMLRDNPLGMAFSALGVAVLYAALFAWLRRRESFRVQGEAFAGLAIAFATLAVPLAVSAQWTASTWALEGAALVWLGLREDRRLPRLSGLALQLLAAGAFLWGFLDRGHALLPGEWPVLNGRCLGALMLAFAAFFISWQTERQRPHRAWVWLAFLWGCAWWIVAGLREIDLHVANAQTANALVGFTTLSMLLAALLRGPIHWSRLGWIPVTGLVLGLPLALGANYANHGPLGNDGWMAWTAFAIAALAVLHVLREPLQRGLSIAHVAFLLTLPLLFGLQLDEWAQDWLLANGWRTLLAWLPLIAVLVAIWRAPNVATFPLRVLFPRYRMRWFVPAAAILLIGCFLSLGQSGDATPLPFVPIANPLELMQFGILLLSWFVVRDDSMDFTPSRRQFLRNMLLLAGFVTLTFATLRAVHHLTGIEWNPAMIDSMVAQTSLTVVWSIVGVGAWIAGSKRGSRPLWLAGAVLMGIVLAKLALVDREHMGNIPGIVSFIAVGLLLTVVGYFAPSPPRRATGQPTP